MSKSSDLGWLTCRGWQPCNCLRMPEARRFQESRMPGNPLVRFDEGRVGRTARCRPLSYSTGPILLSGLSELRSDWQSEPPAPPMEGRILSQEEAMELVREMFPLEG